uniref:ANK_REP_REGION domain-containing protein n=1 Tax=Anisakis simplex TaxID=6269 RepID=A0A0M3J778_ANISI
LSAGLKWYAEDENGTLRSRAVEYLAQHGSFEILNALKEWDAKHTDSQSALVHFTYDNDNPLVGVIEHWIRFGPSEGAKTWLRIFADKFGANTLMRYERPAFDGLVPWLGNRPEPAFTRMTPLIRAIQAKCVTLVTFLVQEKFLKTNLNQPDENGLTPLMHACMVNDDQI